MAIYEFVNDKCYEDLDGFSIYLDDLFQRIETKNVFAISNLRANNSYKLLIKDKQDDVIFEDVINTPCFKEVCFSLASKNDVTSQLQLALDKLERDEYLHITKGDYHIVSIRLKSNIHIEIDKDVVIHGEVDRTKYPILKGTNVISYQGMDLPEGSWEGRPSDVFASIFYGINVSDVSIYGEGIIDYHADESDFYINHRVQRIAWRPKGLFFHSSSNITVASITIKNSPSWSIHPFYCDNFSLLGVNINNKHDSPTTDGIDPESCHGVNIIGCSFNVGDDCIAIKSGREECITNNRRKCEDIIIRNCLMACGHAGVALGSESSGGINNVLVTQCLFKETDRGLRIKTQRGRGNSPISNISFDKIKMIGVKVPFTINAFYKAGNDKVDYRFNREYLNKDEKTPQLGEFVFKNIIAEDVEWAGAYFLGLPESLIKSVTMENVCISYASSTHPGSPIMTVENEKMGKKGLVLENIERIVLRNTFIDLPKGDRIIARGNIIVEEN